jgi:hypothetical protein
VYEKDAIGQASCPIRAQRPSTQRQDESPYQVRPSPGFGQEVSVKRKKMLAIRRERAVRRRAHFLAGGSCAEWLGLHHVHPNRKRAASRRACRGTGARHAVEEE